MRTLLAAFLLFVAAGTARASEPDYAPWDGLLSRYLVASGDGVNRVDYRAWKASPADRAALDRYIAGLEGTRPSAMSRNERFAYWANLYNAVTVKVILDRYPVKSITEIKSTGTGLFDFKAAQGPWRTKRVRVEGKPLSLDDIEQGVLRPEFHDPRVHYAVNCASLGCPNLRAHAFRAASLDAELDQAARDYVNHPRGVSVEPEGLRLSSIYQWYASDFGSAEELKKHLARYAAPEKAERIRAARGVVGYRYDWALNEGTRR